MRCHYLLAFALFSGWVTAAEPDDALNHLIPAYQFKGEEPPTHSLEERLKYWQIPGVSITVFQHGKVLWTHSQGVKNQYDEPVTDTTAFQLASMSKPVSSLLALRAVEQGKITLDEDIRPYVIPELQGIITKKVTLRQLLSHTGGFPTGGGGGFTRGEHYPTLAQVASGEFGDYPLEQSGKMGEFAYSNVGYLMVRSVLESVYKKSFTELANEQIIHPLNLKTATFEQKHPERLGIDLANGYSFDQWILGGWNRYTSQAGAGLWSSTSDFARILLSAHQSSLAENDDFLKAESVALLSEAITPNYGLGFFRHSDDKGTYLFHGGINHGFQSHFAFYPEQGTGAVVATNGVNGDMLALEIIRGLSVVYDWPNYQRHKLDVERPNVEELKSYLGRYIYSPDFYIDVTEKDGQLYVQGKDQMKLPVYKVGKKLYRAAHYPSDFEFDTGWFTSEITSVKQITPTVTYQAEKE
ncbi:serine hydrolase domain-containing protein [Vibrio sonorensis]|uniref:serine hydrolase domain-containing protein n=1 Tax=Vibrio sonorensis TaxID=1004316 RepID=UPI0008D9B035|nr:serine hydrolase domain-containing protein [Vibrio sonorensis]